MNLPEQFLLRMKRKLGEKFPDFLRSYELPAQKGIRVNALKISPARFEEIAPFALSPVPWAENAYYVEEDKVGGFAEHFAGLYYSQEPSATCAVPLLNVRRGERVLDLCAAPGGKTTQLAAAMDGEGLLVANEYVFSRANILSQNIERMGVKNALVTSGDTARLADCAEGFFDKILVDAPCSGEGMFKKEENALIEWSEENVLRCALRQKEILRNAARMLRGGGRMVYSTCTFSEEENENQVENFLQEHPNFRLIEMHRLMPHEVRGEGHFAALFERTDEFAGRVKLARTEANKEAQRAFQEFSDDFFVLPHAWRLVQHKERLYSLPDGAIEISLPHLRYGLELGEYGKGVFKPAHALAMSVKREEVKRFVSLSREQAEKYLRGDTVESEQPNGWCVVGFGEYPLGIGKIVNGTVKNHYPKGLRRVK